MVSHPRYRRVVRLSWTIVLAVAACCPTPRPITPRPATLSDAIVWDLEHEVTAGQQPFLSLFDLEAAARIAGVSVPQQRYVLGEEYALARAVVGRGRCATTTPPAGLAIPEGAGGVIGVACRGGRGRIALLWTSSTAGRGYALLAIRVERP